MVVSGPGDAT